MKKRKYECGVHGVVLTSFKNMQGVCANSSVTVESKTYCVAHGNNKCKHKVQTQSANTD